MVEVVVEGEKLSGRTAVELLLEGNRFAVGMTDGILVAEVVVVKEE